MLFCVGLATLDVVAIRNVVVGEHRLLIAAKVDFCVGSAFLARSPFSFE